MVKFYTGIRMFQIVLVISVSLFSVSIATCPHGQSDLELWSASSTWKNLKPAANQNITITKPILLDESPPELFSITIENGGRLVWSPSANPTLSLHYLLIKDGGEMHIGSESCKYDGKTSITLLGEPGELSIPGFGEKFIGVEKGGTLELHGREKLSWTKITKTIPAVDWGAAIKYYKRRNVRFNALTFVRFSNAGQVKDLSYFSWSPFGILGVEGDGWRVMRGMQTGEIFVMVFQSTYQEPSDQTGFYNAIEGIAGTNIQVRNIYPKSSYVLVAVKGDPSKTTESIQVGGGVAKVDFSSGSFTVSVTADNNNNNPSASFQEIFAADPSASQPVLDLVDDVSSWDVGDKVVVTSTDYWFGQAEEKEIINCPQCNSNQIKVNSPFTFEHYGKIYKRVDMRAEVALLTRNIVIQGKVSSGQTNGGHVKFLKGFKSVRVEGVELTKMGQPLALGRYPLHYHMCEDLDDSALYPKRSYLRRNSIHHTQFRCVTIHGTHGAQLTENVCYDTFGHGFFLEDGGEKRTYFEKNIGLSQKKWNGRVEVPVTGTVPTDRNPVTFWITNPKTTLINNVAAGGEGVGIWFVYPDLPTGPSRSKNFMQLNEAKHTPITKFENNVIHSYIFGLQVDNIEHDNLTVSGYNEYDPKTDPLNPASAPIQVEFSRVTAYKNRFANLWVRGGGMTVKNSSFSDSETSIFLLNEKITVADTNRILTDSVVIGESDNLGRPEEVTYNTQRIKWPRSNPMPFAFQRPRRGIQIDTEGQHIDGVFFDGFNETQYYKSSAFQFEQCKDNFFHTGLRFFANNVKFGFDDSVATGSRLYDGNDGTKNFCSKPSDELHTLTDKDGSLVNHNGKQYQVMRPNQFTLTGECQIRDNWKMAFCPHKYGFLEHHLWEVGFSTTNNKLITMRTDTPYQSMSQTRSMVILGGSHNYLTYFENKIVKHLRIEGLGVTKSDTVRLAVCVPRDAKIHVFFKMGWVAKPTQSVCSLRKVDTDTIGGSYYFDKDVGVVFFKFIHNKDFAEAEASNCPGNICPAYEIYIESGNMNDSDCSTRFKNVLEFIEPSTGAASSDNTVISKDMDSPPNEWGAGSTYPS